MMKEEEDDDDEDLNDSNYDEVFIIYSCLNFWIKNMKEINISEVIL